MVDADSKREQVRKSAVRIKIASGSEEQKKYRDRLLKVINRYGGLNRWLFTRQVLIDNSTFSHSHPVLTLGAKSPSVKTDSELLSVFLHEQMHWHLSQNPAKLRLAMKDLRGAYPRVKVGREEGGARNEESTYLHLLVCLLEVEALTELLGRRRAFDLILKKPYYAWIYRTVASDYSSLKGLVERRGLLIRPDAVLTGTKSSLR